MSKEDFIPWGKIPRDHKELVVITEKLHGTNACLVVEDGKLKAVQSRKNFINPELPKAEAKLLPPEERPMDNFGLAHWAYERESEIVQMGDGHHFGEWVGTKINKNKYCLDNKRFFLFNTKRWADATGDRPECLDVVPVLSYGFWTPTCVAEAMADLLENGSYVTGKGDQYDGWTEGVVTYYLSTDRYVKSTHEHESGKWADDQNQVRESRMEALKALYPDAKIIPEVGAIDYGDSRFDRPV